VGQIPVPVEPALRGPAGVPPPRRPGSVRRTSTIDATWPAGLGTDTLLSGRARDLLTGRGGVAWVDAEAAMQMAVGTDRRIRWVATSPDLTGIAGLAGTPSISGYRARLAEFAAGEAVAATPLHLLLDDVPGASLVSAYAPSRWHTPDQLVAAGLPEPGTRVMRDACIGFRAGSSALTPEGTAHPTLPLNRSGPLDAGEDALAWHDVPAVDGMSLRRSRRLDVWTEGHTVHVDAFFQDSAAMPDGGRQSLHEYTLTAEADTETCTLRAVHPVPRVLPHMECPLAVPGADRLVGTPLAELRSTVLRELRGAAGCTHLSDLLRSLADVPALASRLAAIEARGTRAAGSA
jgi:hypothetical protein